MIGSNVVKKGEECDESIRFLDEWHEARDGRKECWPADGAAKVNTVRTKVKEAANPANVSPEASDTSTVSTNTPKEKHPALGILKTGPATAVAGTQVDYTIKVTNNGTATANAPITVTDTLPVGEDCLTLHVWTPALDNARRPVMVWLHGGAWSSGDFDQHELTGMQRLRPSRGGKGRADTTPPRCTGIIAPIRLDYRYTPGTATSLFLRAMKEGRFEGRRCPSVPVLDDDEGVSPVDEGEKCRAVCRAGTGVGRVADLALEHVRRGRHHQVDLGGGRRTDARSRSFRKGN